MYFNKKHKETIENREDNYEYICSYHNKEMTIDKKICKKSNMVRVKCPYCRKEYDVRLDSFKKGNKCTNCCNSYENSFAYYIQQELKEPLSKYWDWDKNVVNPYLISKSKNIKVWIKCDKKDYHGSYKVACNHFYNGSRCGYCNSKKIHPKDSFAQWGINTFGENFLTKYWSPKNTLNPWELAPQSNKKIWILCQDKDYHNDNGGYEISCYNFYKNRRCPYCNSSASNKVHPKDSFGYLYPQKNKYWSKNNKKSSFEVAPKSGQKFKFYCEDCGKEFEATIYTFTEHNRSMKCQDCTISKGEQKIKEWLVNNNIEFIPQKTFKYLIGIRNGLLSYDFYLPQYNLLIEYQGEQHEKYSNHFHSQNEGFKRQKEHDRRKKKYAKDNNIKLLEIWYYDYENIEEILNNALKGEW